MALQVIANKRDIAKLSSEVNAFKTEAYRLIGNVGQNAQQHDEEIDKKLLAVDSIVEFQQQQQYISVKQQLDQLNEYMNTIEPINFGFINTEVIKLIEFNNILVKKNTHETNVLASKNHEQLNQIITSASNTQEHCNKNLERIRKRSKLYDGNFRLIYQTLTTLID